MDVATLGRPDLVSVNLYSFVDDKLCREEISSEHTQDLLLLDRD